MHEALHVVESPPPEPVAAAAAVLPARTRWRIFLYLGGLTTLLAFADPNGGLMDVPISFLLKNKLGMEAQDVAQFRAFAGAPLYLSFAFGLLRDSWNPFGMKDRGFMLIFGTAACLLFFGFASMPVTRGTLVAALILLTTAFLFVASAQNGLASTLGRQHAMTGQISAAWNVFSAIPAVAALALGGGFSQLLAARNAEDTARILFLVGAAVSALIVLYAAMRPRSVFDNILDEHPPVLQPLRDLRRLARHRPVYPALAIWLLWNFAPGSTTPLQYYLQNTLGAQDAQWGVWNAIFAASFIPTFTAYGFLCRRFPLRVLLWVGTLIAIPQFVPLLFMRSIEGALFAAVPIGLMGGIATAAYLDLIMRSCPPGLQGTTLMMSGGLYYVSTRVGDVLGTQLYDRFGNFTICVLTITATYASILAVLLFVPRDLTARSDGDTRA